ncbi:hypothetical protein BN903_15 [Halorubrum sp. AJ67]|nr:hypothetical protein BN903_15 [Halorubrum sp. AJ67]
MRPSDRNRSKVTASAAPDCQDRSTKCLFEFELKLRCF